VTARDDEQSYRVLLESAQRGIENAKAFLDAISTSEIALKNEAIQSMTVSTKEHLEKLEREADQLWDLFKRVLRGD
jgi:hypothetical protein